MSAELRPVVLLGLPVGVHRRAVEHSATIRRELAVVRLAADHGSTPDRLRELADELGSRYAGFGSGQDPIMGQALASGDALVTLRYDVPVAAVEIFEHLDRTLDEVDEHCRSGDLVSLVTPPDVMAYRRWFLAEMVGQVRDGRPPQPYAGPGVPASAAASSQGSPPAVVAVHDDLDLLGVARVREDVAAALEGGATSLTLDLGDCEFVDSVGVSLLVTTLHRLHEGGGHLVLTRVHDRVRTTLAHAGVLDLLGGA